MSKKKITWALKKVPVGDLVPNEKNPRIFRDDEMAELGKSIDRFGQAEPLVANLDNKLIGGHARLAVMQQRGEDLVDVYFPNRPLTEKEADELMLRLNRNIAGTFDMEKVYQMFPAEQLLDFGFHEYELDLGAKIDTEGFGFRRPEFDEPGPDKEGAPNACYFYVEYYGDEALYLRIKEAIGENMDSQNSINAEYFARLVLGEEIVLPKAND